VIPLASLLDTARDDRGVRVASVSANAVEHRSVEIERDRFDPLVGDEPRQRVLGKDGDIDGVVERGEPVDDRRGVRLGSEVGHLDLAGGDGRVHVSAVGGDSLIPLKLCRG